MSAINTNVMSLNSQRVLMNSQSTMATSLQRLSSGLRINSAKDDAAGLAIAERFTSQIRGLTMANRNANDGISMLQTAEGGLDEVGNMLQRMRELAVQSKNGTVSDDDRGSLDNEFSELKAEISRIFKTTEFNGVKLLGASASIHLQVGYKNGTDNEIKVSFGDMAAQAKTAGGISFVVATAASRGISAVSNASRMIGLLDDAINVVSEKRADFGAKQNRLESTVRNNANIIENQSAARSRIQDTDFAAETANLTRAQILQQAGTAMLAQANALPQNVLSLLR